MNRSFIILIGALALGAVIFAGAFAASRQATVVCCTKPADNLDWLRTEFHLSEAQMARVRELHEGYRPQCAAMCAKIAAKKSELDAALAGSPSVTAEIRPRWTKWPPCGRNARRRCCNILCGSARPCRRTKADDTWPA